MRTALVVFLFLLSISLSGQEKRMRTIHGKVTDKKSGLSISDVRIRPNDTNYYTTSGKIGEYKFSIPKRSRSLFYSHPDYEEYHVKINPFAKRVDVRMIPIIKIRHTYGPARGHFAIGFLPMKLMWGALGVKLEVFMINKLSAGTFFDWYFSGFQYFGGEKYSGYKISPFMRFYFIRNEKHAIYTQGSAVYGYFDFEKLNYTFGDEWPYEISIGYLQESWGFGIGLGYCVTLIDTKLKRLFVDINLGIQYLPANWPEENNSYHGRTADHNKTWWYLGGPGSIIELKLSLGGIF